VLCGVFLALAQIYLPELRGNLVHVHDVCQLRLRAKRHVPSRGEYSCLRCQKTGTSYRVTRLLQRLFACVVRGTLHAPAPSLAQIFVLFCHKSQTQILALLVQNQRP
jgi:hypothetical protein